MIQPYVEYRYGGAARKRAALWLIASGLFVFSIGVLLVTRWAELTSAARIIGLGLAFALLLMVRAQSTRLTLRCLIWPDRLQIIAPLANRLIPWADVIEVRRVNLVQASGQRRWACAVMTCSARGAVRPNYVFDDQLEGAEDALRALVTHTPQAEHVNI